MEEIHDELEGIMNDAGKALQTEMLGNLLGSIKEFEEILFNDRGDPDTNSEIWALTLEDGETESEDHKMGIALFGEGPSIWSGFKDIFGSVAITLVPDQVGILVRVGAWGSHSATALAINPSAADDKENVILTIALCANTVFVVSRMVDTNTVDAKVIGQANYIKGESRLVDEFLKYCTRAQHIKKNSPEMYDDLVREIKEAQQQEE